MKEARILFIHKNKIVGVLDCNPIRVWDSSSPLIYEPEDRYYIKYAPKDINGEYVKVRVGDEIINGTFYRNGELLEELKC